MKTGVSYYGSRIPWHVKKDLEEIKKHHCNFVVHTFTENDLEFYEETMKEIVKISQDLGLEVWLDPWGVGRVFGGEAYSQFINLNLKARRILLNGESAPLACLNNELFRKFMRKWLKAALSTGAEVIFWDEPHKEECYCPVCKEIFRERYGSEMPEKRSREVKKFAQGTRINFLEEMTGIVHSQGKKNAVCLLPSWSIRLIDFEEWERIASLKGVDIFGTDPYWIAAHRRVKGYVRAYAKKVVELCEKYNKEAQIWIQAYRIPQGREKEVEIAASTAYKWGIRNFAAWSYYGTGYMSSHKCANPELVWKIIGDFYAKLARD